tara:strand:- start:51 stop:227 length:177 start_codon:yes stop_codon:yes gene_type:complete
VCFFTTELSLQKFIKVLKEKNNSANIQIFMDDATYKIRFGKIKPYYLMQDGQSGNINL